MVLDLKVDQNEDIKKEIMGIEGNCYEATYDSFWGCSLPVSKKYHDNFKEAKGQNHLGKLWESLRDQLLEQR